MTVRIAKQPIDLRSKLSELERPIGLKGSELMRAETAQEARELVGAGRKNLIINGSFQIWQRNTDYDNTTTDWDYYSVDRYKTNRSRLRQVTTIIDGREAKALEISPGAAGYNGGRGILQKIEDYKIYNKVTVLSAYIKSNVPATADFGFIYDSGAGAAVPNSGKTINTTTEFQKFEITNPSFNPSASPDTYIINELTNGVTYTIANVQLEYGKNATEFEHRSYGEELALCQRYFWYAGSNLSYWTGRPTPGPTWKTQTINFPVAMRTNPTVIEQTLSNTSPSSGWQSGYYPANGNGVAHSWGGGNWAQWFTPNGALLTFQGVTANSATGASAPSGTVATGDELQIINLSFNAEL